MRCRGIADSHFDHQTFKHRSCAGDSSDPEGRILNYMWFTLKKKIVFLQNFRIADIFFCFILSQFETI